MSFVLGGDGLGLLLANHAVGPRRALLDPLLDQRNLLLRQRAALRLRRHQSLVGRRNNQRRVERALARLAGNDALALLAGRERGGLGVELHVTLGVALAVADDALLLDDRLDVLAEIHRGGGRVARESGKGQREGSDGEINWFHSFGSSLEAKASFRLQKNVAAWGIPK